AILFFALGLLLVVAILNQLQVLAEWLLQTYTGEKLVLDFRARLFHHVQRISLSYHDYRGTADSLYRIQNDAPAIQEIAIYGLIPLVTSAITLSAMIFVTARIDWQLALVAMTVAPLYFILVLFIGIRHVQSGTLTLGQLLLVIGYLTQLYGPAKTISSKAAGLQSNLVRVERAFLLLDEPADVPDKPDGRPLSRALGAVTF